MDRFRELIFDVRWNRREQAWAATARMAWWNGPEPCPTETKCGYAPAEALRTLTNFLLADHDRVERLAVPESAQT